MLAFVRRKGSADTVSTSPSSSTEGGDELLSALQPPPPPPTATATKKKRPLTLRLRASRDARDSGPAPAPPKDAAIPGADKDAAGTASLASHVVWKLAMRMSLRNENRFLQHLSRSMLSMGSTHKVRACVRACV